MLKQVISSMLDPDGSVAVTNKKLIKKFVDNPDFPFLVSFPRTGSHWLRTIMELYFEKPSLIRIFYYKKATDFTCYHSHDIDLMLERKNVIYLFRSPVPTIYSQLNYYKEDINDVNRIQYWSFLYGKHLAKWLFLEEVTEKKTFITYEKLRENMHSEFEKVTRHFDLSLDKKKLDSILVKTSKDKIKDKTKHDQNVINLSRDYENQRQNFIERWQNVVFESVLAQNEKLIEIYNENWRPE
jgi:hypothetical protein